MGHWKSLSLIGFGLFLSVFFEPVWGWFVSRQLDQAADDPEGFYAGLVAMMTALAPYQYFLLGTAFGIFFALTIGYWPKIRVRLFRSWLWVRALLWLIWELRPGKRRIAFGGVRLMPSEIHKTIESGAPVDTSSVEIKWWPENEFYCCHLTPTQISIARVNRYDSSSTLVHYEVWGRRKFLATLRHWRNTDLLSNYLAFKQMQKRVKAAKVKGAIPSLPAPLDTATKTPP
jgi:hypothetical protein